MVDWWCCGSCGTTTNEYFSTCNRCHAPRESAPSADGYVERTVSEAQPRSAEELRDVAARLLALAEEKEGGAAPTPAPAAAPTAGGSSSEESDDEGAPAPFYSPSTADADRRREQRDHESEKNEAEGEDHQRAHVEARVAVGVAGGRRVGRGRVQCGRNLRRCVLSSTRAVEGHHSI